MGNNKIYISGKITGNEYYKEQFFAAEQKLKKAGFTVINPIKHEKKGMSWKWYMIKDIKQLLKCNSIYMLPNWLQSKGAVLEHTIAVSLDITVIYE